MSEAPSGGWDRRRGFVVAAAIMAGLALVALVALAAVRRRQDGLSGRNNNNGHARRGSATDPRASVTCQTATHAREPAVSCTVSHRQGSEPFNVCWNVAARCDNGVRPTAHHCLVVQPRATQSVIIPKAQISRVDDCDSPAELNVENLVIARR